MDSKEIVQESKRLIEQRKDQARAILNKWLKNRNSVKGVSYRPPSALNHGRYTVKLVGRAVFFDTDGKRIWWMGETRAND